MKELLRSVRLLFARELDRAEAVIRFFRRRLRGRNRERSLESRAPSPDDSPRRGPRLKELLARRDPKRARRRRRGHPRRASRGRRRRLGVLCGTTALSIVLHGVILVILVILVRPTAAPAGRRGERTILVVLLSPTRAEPPAPVRPAAPPVEPEPSRVPPAPEPGETLEEPDPTTDRPSGESAPEREGTTPESSSLRTLDASAHSIVEVPLPIGVGPSPSNPGSAPRSGGAGFPRRGAGKGEALLRHGGGDHTEDAVERGLRWLAEHQDTDGGWSAEGFQRHCGGHVPCSGRGIGEFDVGVTALATLAFLGAGHLPRSTKNPKSAPDAQEPDVYGEKVADALRYLLLAQDSRGFFGVAGQHYLYNHSLATFALAEATAMTQQERFRSSLEQAVAATLQGQQSGGGWDYMAKPSGRNDLSITGWQVMALRSAQNAGVEVSEAAWNRVRYYLRRAVTPQGEGIYCDLGQEKGRRGINMVSVGLLTHLYLGARPEEPALRGAVERLLRRPPDSDSMATWDRTFESYYYWYTATLALFHVGGEPWKAWNVFLLREVLPLQSRKPHEDGSWAPEMNWIGVSGGRVYATAINVLTLETYYRYEPLYETRQPPR